MQWQDARQTLRALVETPRFGLVTDVDGTISPIVDDPAAAQVTPRAKDLLTALCDTLPLVAVISGRAPDDVRQRVGVEGIVYVGNHGFERWEDGGVKLMPEAAAFRPRLDAAIRALRPHLAPGMELEDKGATISIHYRRAVDPAAAARDFRPLAVDAAETGGLTFSEGRMVFELRPPLDVNKGTAFRGLVAEYDLDAALYLGDDVTDVDALTAAREMRAGGVCNAYGAGVLSEGTPEAVADSADFTIPSGVPGVESLLSWLLMARRASST
jgi:trehalose 6-phosphate phosphatase